MENINKIFEQNNLYNYQSDDIVLKEDSIEGNLEANLVVFYSAGELSALAIDQKEFLMKMLGAVKHNMENTLLISDKTHIPFKNIVQGGFAKKIMFFGSTRKTVSLNLDLKRYKIFNIQDIDCLFVDTIPIIQENQKKKSALWSLMKIMFSI